MDDNAQKPAVTKERESLPDAVEGSWVNTQAPAFSRPYLRLSRMDRPIGSWLLLLPCWWSLSLAIIADPSTRRVEDIWLALACAFGAVLMRGAGCSWNDLADRKLDADVRRTRSRPLPSGQITPRQALVWMTAQASLAFGLLLTFNSFAIFLGIMSLVPVAFYPFAKRITWWPQIFLGIAFNWGALLAWAAHSGTLSLSPVLLYFAGIFWTLFYDTIYAHQDRDDDGVVGIRSTARLLNSQTEKWLVFFLVCAVTLMTLSVAIVIVPSDKIAVQILAGLGIGLFSLHLLWQLRRLDIDNNEVCLMLFRANRNAGLAPAICFACAAMIA